MLPAKKSFIRLLSILLATASVKYRNAGGNGRLRFLPSKVLDSDAVNALSKSSKLVLVISPSQIDYRQNKYHKRVPRRDCSIGRLRNDGHFSLPLNLLKERGIRGSNIIARACKKIVAAEFWETIETGTLHNSGVFRWSDNRLAYNQKPLAERKSLDPSAKALGYCHYPKITKYNDHVKAQKASEQDITYQDQDYHISRGNNPELCSGLAILSLLEPLRGRGMVPLTPKMSPYGNALDLTQAKAASY